MRYFYYMSNKPGGGIMYLHVFRGHMSKDKTGYAEVKKSIIKFGRQKVLFQKPGELIYLGEKPASIESRNICTVLVKMVFEDDFDFSENYFQEINI